VRSDCQSLSDMLAIVFFPPASHAANALPRTSSTRYAVTS
jgi:hypothetical protein